MGYVLQNVVLTVSNVKMVSVLNVLTIIIGMVFLANLLVLLEPQLQMVSVFAQILK